MKYLFPVVILVLFNLASIQAQYKLEKLNDQINTEYDEICPIVLEDGKTLFFTRLGSPDFQKTLFQNDEDLSTSLNSDDYSNLLRDVYSQIANKNIKKPVSSSFNQDVWMAVDDRGTFDQILHPGFPINNALPNSVIAYSFKDYSLIVINQFGKDGSLYHGFSKTRQISTSQFEFPEPIYINDFYSSKSEISATMSYDGDVIILSLDRQDSEGNLDLYISFKLKDNLWSSPESLGSDINTPYRELTPFLSRDKRRLFFASNRPSSQGGLDIYVSRRLDIHWKKWSKPRRLIHPINSSSDDSQPYYDEFNDQFYFSSRRDGSSDIFRVDLNPEAKNEQPVTVAGTIRNKHTDELISAEIVYQSAGPLNKSSYFRTNNGQFNLQIDFAYPITFIPSKNGFRSMEYTIDPKDVILGEDQTIEVRMELEPEQAQSVQLATIEEEEIEEQPIELPYDEIEDIVAKPSLVYYDIVEYIDTDPIIVLDNERIVGDFLEIVLEEPEPVAIAEEPRETIELGNILFLQSKSQLIKSSYPHLNKLVRIMKDNKKLLIRVEGHTDNIGDENALLKLSQQRATGIKEYLVYKGILPERVKVEGFGGGKPLNENETEADRKANRRVEIVILEQ